MQILSKDLERRKVVWQNLSELFLDTELSSNDIERISASLLKSGYSIEELEHILQSELAPVLRTNLSTPAGIYLEFDIDWLSSEILKRQKHPLRWISNLWAFRFDSDDWNRVLKQLNFLRS